VGAASRTGTRGRGGARGVTLNVEKVYDTLVSVTFLVYTLPTTKSLNSSTLGLARNAWVRRHHHHNASDANATCIRASDINAARISPQATCIMHEPTGNMHHASAHRLNASCISPQATCIMHQPTGNMHHASAHRQHASCMSPQARMQHHAPAPGTRAPTPPASSPGSPSAAAAPPPSCSSPAP
jgi:hypothetical protein